MGEFPDFYEVMSRLDLQFTDLGNALAGTSRRFQVWRDALRQGDKAVCKTLGVKGTHKRRKLKKYWSRIQRLMEV